MEVDVSRMTHMELSISIIKCSIGAGAFTLAKLFSQCGVILSVFVTLLLALLNAYTLNALLRCSDWTESAQTLHDTTIKRSPKTYPEIACHFFSRKWFCGRNMVGDLVTFSIILTCLGVCAAYIDFVASALPTLLGVEKVEAATVRLLLSPILLVLSLIPTFKMLSYTSSIGDVAVLSSCSLVLVGGIIQFNRDVSTGGSFVWGYLMYGSDITGGLPRLIGSLTFLFGVHVVVLPSLQRAPLERDCDGDDISISIGDEARRHGMRERCVYMSYGFLGCFNATFGAFGALLFARQIDPECTEYITAIGPCVNVLDNLGGGGVLVGVVRGLLCLDLLLTSPLILAAAREILMPKVIRTLIRLSRHGHQQEESSGHDLEIDEESHTSNNYCFAHKLRGTSSVGGSRAHPLARQHYQRVDVHAHAPLPFPGSITVSPMTSSELAVPDPISISPSQLFCVTCDNDLNKPLPPLPSDSMALKDDNGHDDEMTAVHIDNVERTASAVARTQPAPLASMWFVGPALRATLVLSAVGLAAGFPTFTQMLDVVGGVVCAASSLVFPPLMYLRVVTPSLQGRNAAHLCTRPFLLLLIVCGVSIIIATIICSFVSL